MEFALGVSSDDWEVADEAKYVATDAVDSYHEFVGGAVVDEVVRDGVTAHRAAAVHHELKDSVALFEGFPR